MPAKTSRGSYNLRTFLRLICQSTRFSQGHSHRSSSVFPRLDHGYPTTQGLRLISTGSGNRRKVDPKLLKGVNVRATAVPAPERAKFPTWARWVLGTILSLLLPFWKQKWASLKRIEGEAEVIVGEAEVVADMVEKAATMAENVSADLAEKLPENGKLKATVLLVEHISKETAHDAQLAKDFIHKVDELKQDFGDLETMVEPVIEKIIPNSE